jgi:hypothetical protein
MAVNAGRMTAIKRKTMERVNDEEELTTKMLGWTERMGAWRGRAADMCGQGRRTGGDLRAHARRGDKDADKHEVLKVMASGGARSWVVGGGRSSRPGAGAFGERSRSWRRLERSSAAQGADHLVLDDAVHDD